MKPTRLPRLPWREIDGRAVVLNPRRGEVHELDPVATFLWARADGTRTTEELAALVTESFEVELEVALTDTRELMSALENRGLLAPQNSA